MSEKNNKIWFDNINILFNEDNLFDIIPTTEMNYNNKINSITRFSIYLCIVLILFTRNLKYIYIPFITCLVFYILHIFNNTEMFAVNNKISETENSVNTVVDNVVNNEINNLENSINEEKNDNCRLPTDNNPLMNMELSDHVLNDKQACNLNNIDIDNNINDIFDKLYPTIEPSYNKKFNQRSFYTMPNTKPANEQGAFANWLYNTPVSCESGDHMLLKQVKSCAYNNKSLEEMNNYNL